MAIAIKLETRQYILKSDAEAAKEEQTIFFIRPLKFQERAEIQDALLETEIQALGPKTKDAARFSKQRIMLGKQMELALMAGLDRIENLKDPDGRAIDYTKSMPNKLKLAVLDLLRVEWCQELTQEILGMSGMTGDEEKN